LLNLLVDLYCNRAGNNRQCRQASEALFAQLGEIKSLSHFEIERGFTNAQVWLE
jgi:hypothetical protein